MKAPNHPPKVNQKRSMLDDNWTATAWVYFIWVVAGYRVYCKIGHSINPHDRYRSVMTGIPERPFQLHLLPCLNQEQARFIEGLFHAQLRPYQTRSEWFSHRNAKHLYRAMWDVVDEIFTFFRTFGYEIDLERIDLDGARPALYSNGFVSHVLD